MGVSYKMILNLPDMRLMENKKNLKREFPSRKSKKKLSSHHLSFPEEVQKVNSKALLLLPESHPWGCRRPWWAKTLYTQRSWDHVCSPASAPLRNWEPLIPNLKCFIHFNAGYPLPPQPQPASPVS